MDEQTTDKSTVAVRVGEIAADVRHILLGQARIEVSMTEIRKEFREEIDRLDKRLTAVEQFVWRAGGVIILVSVLFPAIMTALGWVVIKG